MNNINKNNNNSQQINNRISLLIARMFGLEKKLENEDKDKDKENIKIEINKIKSEIKRLEAFSTCALDIISKIPECRLKKIMKMYFCESMPVKEIGKVLKCSDQTVYREIDMFRRSFENTEVII